MKKILCIVGFTMLFIPLIFLTVTIELAPELCNNYSDVCSVFVFPGLAMVTVWMVWDILEKRKRNKPHEVKKEFEVEKGKEGMDEIQSSGKYYIECTYHTKDIDFTKVTFPENVNIDSIKSENDES